MKALLKHSDVWEIDIIQWYVIHIGHLFLLDLYVYIHKSIIYSNKIYIGLKWLKCCKEPYHRLMSDLLDNGHMTLSSPFFAVLAPGPLVKVPVEALYTITLVISLQYQ